MLMRVFGLALLAGAVGAGGVLAGDEPAKPSSCAMVRSIDYWKPIDDTHAILYTSPRRKYKVTFFAPCRELKWAIFARLETRPSSGLCLSAGDTLIFGRGAPFASQRFEFEERCTITAVEALPFDDKEPMPAKPTEAPPQ